MKITSKISIAALAALALALGGCDIGSLTTSQTDAVLLSIDGSLASVSCPSTASSANTIADSVITIAAPNQAAATADAQLAAASANLAAELCPGLQNVANVVIQATVASNLAGTPTQTITTASLKALERKAIARRRAVGKPVFKVATTECVTTSLAPFTIQCKAAPAS